MRSRRSLAPHRLCPSAVFTVLLFAAVGCDAGAPLLQGSSGVTEGDPFLLDAGHHVVAWTASPQTTDGCALLIDLVHDDGSVVRAADESFDGGGARQDVTPGFQVSAGTYRLRADTTCEEWTARVAPESRRR